MVLVRLFATFLLCSPWPVQLYAQTAEDFLVRGDAFAKKFDNEKALQAYRQAYQADTSNCTALWKIAEAYVNLGEEADKGVQRQYYYTAEKWARKALASCPNTPNAHFMVAVTSGLLALYEGGKAKIRRSKDVKAEAEKTLKLDPTHHGAYHVLGRWHMELASLNWFLKAAAKIIYGGVPPGASYEEAEVNFKKAIEINPNWIAHYRQLGVLYLKMEKWELARQAFQKALELPILDHQDEEHKEACRELLKDLPQSR